MTDIFIDGKNGTTGLKIEERLKGKKGVNLIVLPEEERKDPAARKKAINSADVVFLCLPDDAAKEAVSMAENPKTVIIDASTAHRTANGWAYGFPELGKEFKEGVKNGKRIAVPGCHASGFIALIYPLVKEGIIDRDLPLYCLSLTGYSGGGKKMIAEYEGKDRDPLLKYPRAYGLTQTHKHLAEMTHICSLTRAPSFTPVVADFYSGMEVLVAIDKSALKKGDAETVKTVYKNLYNSQIVRYNETSENGYLSAGALAGKDGMEISVFGNDERITLFARYDNLGKGASGAAVECLNLVLGRDETEGLRL